MSTPDFLRSHLEQMIDLRHPLAVLAARLPWALIKAAMPPKPARQAKPGKREIGARGYFCDRHSPWQRGFCENTNGLLRQCLPKGNDLCTHSQDELDGIADSLYNRPRATYAFHSPPAVFGAMLANLVQPNYSVH